MPAPFDPYQNQKIDPAQANYDRFKLKKAAASHRAIKEHYLNQGKTQQQWQAVAQNPQQFNRVWRSMLRLRLTDKPPPPDERA